MSPQIEISTANAKMHNVSSFPPEVDRSHDDVTPEALQFLRDRVKPKTEGRNWRLIEAVSLGEGS